MIHLSPKQVRGHLAAQTDPLNLNNMNRDDAQKLIIRSVTVQEADMDSVFQLPSTTWIGGKVPTHLPTHPSTQPWNGAFVRSIV